MPKGTDSKRSDGKRTWKGKEAQHRVLSASASNSLDIGQLLSNTYLLLLIAALSLTKMLKPIEERFFLTCFVCSEQRP
jgi:hypothetical protein